MEDNPLNLSILDKNTAKVIDVLQVALMRVSRFSLLPELYEIFGKETLVKFLDIFAGTIVQVPSREILERAIRDTSIFMRLSEAKDDEYKRAEALDFLAARFGISRASVITAHESMCRFLRACGVEVRNGRENGAGGGSPGESSGGGGEGGADASCEPTTESAPPCSGDT